MVVDGPVIGIDIGYSYSRVPVWHNNRIVVIPNDLNELHTPSCVAFTKEEDGLLVGEAAKNQIGSNPENTIFEYGEHLETNRQTIQRTTQLRIFIKVLENL